MGDDETLADAWRILPSRINIQSRIKVLKPCLVDLRQAFPQCTYPPRIKPSLQTRSNLPAGKCNEPVRPEKVIDDFWMGPQLLAELDAVDTFEHDTFFKKLRRLHLDGVLQLGIRKTCANAKDKTLRRCRPFALQEVVNSLLNVGRFHLLPISHLPTDVSTAVQTGINVDPVLSLTGSAIWRAVFNVGILA